MTSQTWQAIERLPDAGTIHDNFLIFIFGSDGKRTSQPKINRGGIEHLFGFSPKNFFNTESATLSPSILSEHKIILDKRVM